MIAAVASAAVVSTTAMEGLTTAESSSASSAMERLTAAESTAAMEGLTTAESTAAMEGLTAAESTAAVEGFTTPEAAVAATESFTTTKSTVTAEAVVPTESMVTATESTTEPVAAKPILATESTTESLVTAPEAVAIAESTEPPALVKFGMPEIEVVPRTGTDEHTAVEPFRTPISIWRAIKRIIRIVAEFTDRRRIVIAVIRTELDTDCDLRLRIHCRQGQNRQQH